MNIIKSYRYSSTRYVYFPWTAWLPFWYQNWTHNVSLDTSPSTSSLESVSWSFTQPRLMGFTGILPFRNVFFTVGHPKPSKSGDFSGLLMLALSPENSSLNSGQPEAPKIEMVMYCWIFSKATLTVNHRLSVPNSQSHGPKVSALWTISAHKFAIVYWNHKYPAW